MDHNKIRADNPIDRVAAVRQLVLPLRPKRNGHKQTVSVKGVAMRAEIVLAVNELGMGASYRDWFFRTEVDTILGQYFEEWTANKSQTEWYLCQACLHLFRKPSLHEAPAPMLSIHCEPRHNGSEIGDRCKRGPHVHVDCAGYPVKRRIFL
jgi:hypothetical protein